MVKAKKILYDFNTGVRRRKCRNIVLDNFK